MFSDLYVSSSTFKMPQRSYREHKMTREKTERHTARSKKVLLELKKFQMVLKWRTTSQETIWLVNVSNSD